MSNALDIIEANFVTLAIKDWPDLEIYEDDGWRWSFRDFSDNSVHNSPLLALVAFAKHRSDQIDEEIGR
jgi:hypothetical protein